MTSTWKKQLLGRGVTFVAVAGLLAGCGSSTHKAQSGVTSPSGTTATTATDATTPTTAGGGRATGSPIKFGAIVTESGADSANFDTAAGALSAWQKWANANGGIDGHPVDIITLDDQASVTVGLADVHTLIDGDHVLSAACFGLGCISTLPPYATTKGVPLVGPSYTNDEATGSTIGDTDVYQVDTSFFAELAVEFKYAKELGATKMGFVQDSVSGASTAAVKAYQQAMAYAGLPLVKSVTMNSNSPSQVAVCLALKQSGANALGRTIGATANKELMDQCATQGYQPILTGQSNDLQPYWVSDPPFSKGMGTLPTFAWWDTSNPAIATFSQVMKQYDPSYAGNPQMATEAWDTMTVFAAAAKAGNVGDNPTEAQLLTGLHTINGDNFGGLTPPLYYANGANTTPPLCAYGAKVDNGQFQLLDGGHQLCATAAQALNLRNIEFGRA